MTVDFKSRRLHEEDQERKRERKGSRRGVKSLARGSPCTRGAHACIPATHGRAASRLSARGARATRVCERAARISRLVPTRDGERRSGKVLWVQGGQTGKREQETKEGARERASARSRALVSPARGYLGRVRRTVKNLIHLIPSIRLVLCPIKLDAYCDNYARKSIVYRTTAERA